MIQEFWTFVTDLVLAAVAWSFAFILARSPAATASRALSLWVWVFVTIGLAAFQGALYHGFKDSLPHSVYMALRIGTLWSLSGTAFFLSLALIYFGLPREHSFFRPLKILLLLKAFIFLVLAVFKTQFLLAILDYGSSFIIALVVHLRLRRHPASPFMLLGVTVSIIAAAIQVLKIAPSASFNHNDLYHVVQLLGLYLFFKGAQRLTDS